MESKLNHALGAFLGAAIGDAIGSYLEFRSKETIASDEVIKALQLPGEGPHRLAPGQITDDTELAIALARGLFRVSNVDHDVTVMDPVAEEYCNWLNSHPFDVGNTCSNAFSVDKGPNCAKRMAEAAKIAIKSKSNGALMRAAPLACLPPDQATVIAELDASLSHSNPSCKLASMAYAAAISTLVHNDNNDVDSAIAAAVSICQDKSNPLTTTCTDPLESWILSNNVDYPMDSNDQGLFKHGFILAFYHLRHKTPFTTAMQDTIARGGDTDTNCAIVGCMLGAYYGADALPEDMKNTVLHCQPNHSRPDEFTARHIPQLVDDLVTLYTRAAN